MSYLSPASSYQDFLLGKTETPFEGSAAPPASSGAPSGGTGSAPASAPAAPAAKPPGVTTAPVIEGIKSGQEALGKTFGAFQQAAGPSRTYSGIGGEETLKGAIGQGASTAQTQAAKQLVNASYVGPTQLGVNDIAQTARTATAGARALRRTPGLQTSLQGSVPGLTSGESRFEARHMLATPGYQEQARGLEEQAKGFQSQVAQREQEAAQYAQQRQAEEKAIADQSRTFLTGQREQIMGGLQQRVGTANEAQQAAQGRYSEFLKTPEQKQLEALQPYAAGTDLTQLNTPEAQQRAAGEAEYNRILNDPRYASIKDKDLLARNITGRGKEYFTAPGAGQKGADIRTDKTLKPEDRKLLKARQMELEAAFRPKSAKAAKKGKEGEFANVMPLYNYKTGEATKPLEGGFKEANRMGYVNFDPGISASIQNQAKPEERFAVNNINDILDEVDRIGEADPFRAATASVDVERYLEDAHKQAEELDKTGAEGAKDWKKAVSTARSRYQKAKAKAKWGQVARIVMGVGSLGGTEAVGAGAKAVTGSRTFTPQYPVESTAGSTGAAAFG